MMKRLGFLFLSLSLTLPGCLRTREDLKEVETNKVMRDQVSVLQKVHADSSSRLEELLDQNRRMHGRIEELEQRLVQNAQAQTGKEDLQKSLLESRQRSELLQEGIVKLESQVQALQEEIITLKTKDNLDKNSNKNNNKGNSKEKNKDKEKELMELALADFQGKRWKEAILNFDQYREKFPNGKFVPEATYRTGVSFQELGMNDEARVFFQEVSERFPKTEASRKAQIRLKSLGAVKKP